MTVRVGVVVFPGSNCEHDVVRAIGLVADRAWGGPAVDAELVWHGRRSLEGYDAVVLPGGFAHGDYLRPGAIARFSPVMAAVATYAAAGGPVVGICNGFQVLTEARLLPGALQKNAGLKFLCETVELRVVSTRRATGWQRKVRPRFFCRAPGSRPASVSTWKPLQMPSTGPPSRANAATAAVTGENRAIAPGRR